MMSQTPVLYGFAVSSCTWRVRAALVYKSVEFHRKHCSPGAFPLPNYEQLNPQQQVPCLLIDGHTLTQSVAVLEYLEETRPSPPLLPKEPVQRARVRQIVEMINSGIQPVAGPSVAKRATGDADQQKEWQVYWLEKGLGALETHLKNTRGKYCVGDELSLADVCLVPQMFSARRFGADLRKFPVCLELYEALLKVDCFIKSHPENQPDSSSI